MIEMNLTGKNDITKLKNLGKVLGIELTQINIPHSFSSKINSLFFDLTDCIDKFSQIICDSVTEKNIKINILTLEKIKKNKNEKNPIVFFVGLPNFIIVILKELSLKFKCDMHDIILTILIERILTK